MENNQIPNIIASLLGTTNTNSNFADKLSDYLQNQQLSSLNSNLWKPNINMFESDTFIKLVISVPGVDPNSIDVEFFNNSVIIRGKRDCPEVLENTMVIKKQEIIYGSFERKIILPISVTQKGSTNIEVDNGLLFLNIDKTIESNNKFTVRLQNQ